MAGSARAVRIARQGDGTAIAVESSPVAGAGPTLRASTPHFPNSAGSSRALRTFLVFLVGLAVIYGLFMGLAVRTADVSASYLVEEVLTAAVAIALVVGWFVTLGQAPAAAWVENGQLVVRERTGRSRRFPVATARFLVLRTNGVGPLGPEPTEFVEVSVPRGAGRTYLVGAHFFDFAQPSPT
jgi:hypothetical protein